MLVPTNPTLVLVHLFFAGVFNTNHAHESLNRHALGTFSFGSFFEVSVHRVVHRLHILPYYWVHLRD